MLLAMLFAALDPSATFACAICYGDPDSPLTDGLTWAILALALVVGCVLTGVVAFFVHANRTAATQTATAAASGSTTKPI